MFGLVVFDTESGVSDVAHRPPPFTAMPCPARTWLPPRRPGQPEFCVFHRGHAGAHVTRWGRWFGVDHDDETQFLATIAGLLIEEADVDR